MTNWLFNTEDQDFSSIKGMFREAIDSVVGMDNAIEKIAGAGYELIAAKDTDDIECPKCCYEDALRLFIWRKEDSDLSFNFCRGCGHGWMEGNDEFKEGLNDG